MSTEVDERLRIAAEALAAGKYAAALHDAEIALADLELDDSTIGSRVQAYEIATRAELHLSDFSHAAEYARHALDLLTEKSDTKRALSLRLDLAECSYGLGDLHQAEYLIHEVHQEAERNEWREILARSTMQSGILTIAKGDFEQAIELFGEALRVFEELNLSAQAIRAHVNLGIARAKLGQPDEGERHFQVALAYYLKRGDAVNTASCQNNLAGLSFARRDWNLTREYLLDCAKYMMDVGNQQRLATVWMNLGLVELHDGNWMLSKKYLMRAMQLAQEAENRMLEAETFMHLSVLSLALANPREATNYAELSAKCFEGSSSVSADSLNSYMPLITLANGHDDLARELWSSRPKTTNELDQKFFSELLQRIISDEYVNLIDLPNTSRKLGEQWLEELRDMNLQD